MNRLGKLAIFAAVVLTFLVATDAAWDAKIVNLLHLNAIDATGEQYEFLVARVRAWSPYMAIWGAAGFIVMVAGRNRGSGGTGNIAGVRLKRPTITSNH